MVNNDDADEWPLSKIFYLQGHREDWGLSKAVLRYSRPLDGDTESWHTDFAE